MVSTRAFGIVTKRGVVQWSNPISRGRGKHSDPGGKFRVSWAEGWFPVGLY
jgi:hypothetical protein